jgi:hypothetical protein
MEIPPGELWNYFCRSHLGGPRTRVPCGVKVWDIYGWKGWTTRIRDVIREFAIRIAKSRNSRSKSRFWRIWRFPY